SEGVCSVRKVRRANVQRSIAYQARGLPETGPPERSSTIKTDVRAVGQTQSDRPAQTEHTTLEDRTMRHGKDIMARISISGICLLAVAGTALGQNALGDGHRLDNNLNRSTGPIN